MRGFTTLALLLALLALTSQASLQFQMAYQQLLTQKAAFAKTGLDGELVHPVLTAHGEGITDGQEKTALNAIDQALQTYQGDLYGNALYIQQKVEESFGGRWNVEVFGNDPSWGRATHIANDQWMLLFGYGDYDWDYIIWAPEC